MEPIGILAWIIAGAIAGWLASRVLTSDLGLIGSIVIGILGGLISGWLFRAIGEQGMTGFSLWSVVVAFFGAVALLYGIEVVREDTVAR